MAGASLTSSRRSASERIGTPAFSAFATFEPGFSPTITPVVFLETLSDTLAPSAASAAAASSRVNASSVPVSTYCDPVSGPSIGLSASPTSNTQPELAQLLDERPVLLVREPLRDRLGAIGPDPVDLLNLLLARSEHPVDRSEVAREVLRCHPAHVRDVQTEENA